MRLPIIPIIGLLTKAGPVKDAGGWLIGLLTKDKKVKAAGGAGATDLGLTAIIGGLGAAVGVVGLPETIDAVQQLIAAGRENWPLVLVVVGFVQAVFGVGRKAGAE